MSTPWDTEIELLTKEVDLLGQIVKQTERYDRASILSRKSSIVQSTINLLAHLDRIRTWVKRPYRLKPEEQAIMHWAKKLGENMQNYLDDKSKLLGRMFWIKLIQARVSTRGASEALESETDELLALATRYTTLNQVATHMETSIQSLQQRQKDLLARYQSIGIATVNREAAGSMQGRLGVDYIDAMTNPSSRAVQSYLQALFQESTRFTSTRQAHKQNDWLNRVREEMTRETRTVLGVCRTTVLSMFGKGKNTPTGLDAMGDTSQNGGNSASRTRLKAVLAEVEQLQVKANEVAATIQNTAVKDMRPHILPSTDYNH